MLIIAPAYTKPALFKEEVEDNGEGSSTGASKADRKGVNHIYVGEWNPPVKSPATKDGEAKEKGSSHYARYRDEECERGRTWILLRRLRRRRLYQLRLLRGVSKGGKEAWSKGLDIFGKMRVSKSLINATPMTNHSAVAKGIREVCWPQTPHYRALRGRP